MRAKQFLELYEAQQQLFEVEMSPSSLRKLASNIPGALAGLEYEMFVPDVDLGGDDDEPEEDMDMDESAIDIDDIVRFFDDSEHNTSRTIRELRRELEEKYSEYVDREIEDAWQGSEGKQHLYDWIKNNVDNDDLAEYLDKTPEEDEEGDKEEFSPTEEDYEEAAEKSWQDEDSYCDDAKEDFINDYDRSNFSERDFLRDIGIYHMSDVNGSVYVDLTWPHWIRGSSGERGITEVAEDISEFLGIPVYTGEYHSGARSPNGYTLETDGSLQKDGYAGLELISPTPPPPVAKTLEDMDKIIEWAHDNDCITNKSCGLHMNISIPNYNRDNLDYVKLAILTGDKYVLDQFGRAANTYCKSAIDIIKSKAANTEQAEQLIDKLRNNVEEIASKILHGGRTDKYTSINVKENRIEFRSPGNDWLNAGTEKLTNTLLRFVVALDAACDPNKYKKEYYRALYKLLKPKDPKSDMSYFARYMSGEMTKEALAGDLLRARKTRLGKSGIEELSESEVDDGDWIVTVGGRDNNTNTIYLRYTKQVSNGTEALSAAQKLYPKIFNKNNVQNTTVQRYKIDIDPDLKLYRVYYGYLNTDVVAKSEQEAEKLVKIIDARQISQFGGDPRLKAEELVSATKRAMKNMLIIQNNKFEEGKHWLESDKIYIIRGNLEYDIPIKYIAAKTEQEAEVIAKLMYPQFDDDANNWYIVRGSGNILYPEESATYRKAQEELIKNNQTNRQSTDDTHATDMSDIKMYRVHNIIGYDYVMAKSEEEAEALATKINYVKFPAGSVTAVRAELDPSNTEEFVRRQNLRLANAPKPYHIIDTRTNQPVPDSTFPVINDHDAVLRLRDYASFGRHGLSSARAREVFAVRPVS